MSDKVISIEEVSKMYRLGAIGAGNLRHDLNKWWYQMRGKENPYLQMGEANDRTKKASSEYVWVLQDINLDIKKGETVGIIGRNGAGKSTLLKIMSRVTQPTKGQIKIKGRVASLLEVGTGFHPELTGRENIFLNGAILGMRKKEIQSKLDEIIDFSGVERYLDTPVKRYSSGMYVRLAFGVAAHLESEILIVDEVLAVGDAEFQKKCLGKMNDATTKEGRTVLFVSHNMAAVQNLCNKGIFLQQGKTEFVGDIKSTIDRYLISAQETSKSTELGLRTDRKGNGIAYFSSVYFVNSGGQIVNNLITGNDYRMRIKICRNQADELKGVVINVGLNNKSEVRIALLSNDLTGTSISIKPEEKEKIIEIALPNFSISTSLMSFTLFMKAGGEIIDWISNAGYIAIENGDYYSTGKIPPSEQGDFLINHSFIV
jgi:lipopolysaccharide transport system ATP-binding protein